MDEVFAPALANPKQISIDLHNNGSGYVETGADWQMYNPFILWYRERQHPQANY